MPPAKISFTVYAPSERLQAVASALSSVRDSQQTLDIVTASGTTYKASAQGPEAAPPADPAAASTALGADSASLQEKLQQRRTTTSDDGSLQGRLLNRRKNLLTKVTTEETAAPASWDDGHFEDVSFEQAGPLGLVIKERTSKADGETYFVLESIAPGSLADQMAALKSNMLLQKIQGESVNGLTLAQATKKMKVAKRPLTLTFVYRTTDAASIHAQAGINVASHLLARGRLARAHIHDHDLSTGSGIAAAEGELVNSELAQHKELIVLQKARMQEQKQQLAELQGQQQEYGGHSGQKEPWRRHQHDEQSLRGATASGPQMPMHSELRQSPWRDTGNASQSGVEIMTPRTRQRMLLRGSKFVAESSIVEEKSDDWWQERTGGNGWTKDISLSDKRQELVQVSKSQCQYT